MIHGSKGDEGVSGKGDFWVESNALLECSVEPLRDLEDLEELIPNDLSLSIRINMLSRGPGA